MFNRKIELDAKLILSISLLHMISADGVIDREELTFLLTALNGDTTLINKADKYIKYSLKNNITLDNFFREANKILTTKQKECIVANMVDTMLIDGSCHKDEEQILEKYMETFNFSKEKYESYRHLMTIKNDHSVFDG